MRPLLEYSDVIWHSALTNKQSTLLYSVQKRSCKIIMGHNYVSYLHALDVFNLQSLSARREQHCLSFAKSLSKSKRTSNLLPPARKDATVRRLRNADDLTQLITHTQRFARSPIPYYISSLNKSRSPLT